MGSLTKYGSPTEKSRYSKPFSSFEQSSLFYSICGGTNIYPFDLTLTYDTRRNFEKDGSPFSYQRYRMLAMSRAPGASGALEDKNPAKRALIEFY